MHYCRLGAGVPGEGMYALAYSSSGVHSTIVREERWTLRRGEGVMTKFIEFHTFWCDSLREAPKQARRDRGTPNNLRPDGKKSRRRRDFVTVR